MIAIIVSITVMFSILLAAFVGFGPNFKSLVEKDFMRKTYENATNYGIKRGQLISRANMGTSNLSETVTMDLRDRGVEDSSSVVQWTQKDYISVQVDKVGEGIDVDVKHLP
ncbi:MAG: hypothetical protein WCY34_06750 [Candidatus Omnitrophota bacterium]|jgi:hypothetical protein